MPMPLTKPEVNELAVVTTTLDLFHEWLSYYFDGGPHDVGGNLAVPFSRPELKFQQSVVTQPSEKPDTPDTLAITLVWNEPGRKWIAWETLPTATGPQRQQVVQSAVSFNFWVRATGSQARRNGKVTADLLHGLLANAAATRALGGKGILRVRATEPRQVSDGDFVLLLVTARAQLRYLMRSQV